MEEINRELFDAYKLATQQLEEINAQLIIACKNAEMKIEEIKKRIEEATIPARKTTIGTIRNILLEAPSEIGESVYKGDDISQEERTIAVTAFKRAFKAQDILLLIKHTCFRIIFTENALYTLYYESPADKAEYAQIKECAITGSRIAINITKHEEPTPSAIPVLDLFKEKIYDISIEWSDYVNNQNVHCKNYLYNLIMDLKDAASATE